MKEFNIKIKRKIGALVVLGMLLAIVLNTTVAGDYGNTIWYRDDTGNDVTLDTEASGYDVGIGTDNPQYKFQVIGDAHVTGAFHDSVGSSGTDGYILKTTGARTEWIDPLTVGDRDWCEAPGLDLGPDSINDDIYTHGWVGIGIDDPECRLDIRSNKVSEISSIGINFEQIFIAHQDDDLVQAVRIIPNFMPSSYSRTKHYGLYIATITPPDNTYALVTEAGSGNVGIGTIEPTEQLHIAGSIRIEDGTETAGYVLTSDADGVGSWQPAPGGVRAGDDIYITGTPANIVNLEDDITVNFIRAQSENSLEIHAWKTTIGAGSNSATGYYSVAMGESTTASSSWTTAMGCITTASGLASTAMGYGSTASGYYSTATGYCTIASGDFSTAMGGGTTATGDYSTAMGRAITAQGDYSFGIGLDNNYPNWQITQANTMAIMGGKVGIGTVSPSVELDVVGDTEISGYLNVDSGTLYANDATNKVGINTASPSTNLHVNGDVAFDRALVYLQNEPEEITVTHSYHYIASQWGYGNLKKINGGDVAGQILILTVNSGNTITVKDEAANGNIDLESDFEMDNPDDTLVLIYDGSNWIELSRSDNA